jgi:hypothetical protein
VSNKSCIITIFPVGEVFFTFSVCGEGKAKKDFEPQTDAVTAGATKITKEKRSLEQEQVNNNNDSDELEFFSYSTQDSNINCGSTIISDKFVIFAAHCQTQFQK